MRNLSALTLLALFAGCTPPQPVSSSEPLGTLRVAWDVAAKDAFTESSGKLRLTPLTYTDLDDLQGGYRYLTATFRAENVGAEPLLNLTLRAYASADGLGGTAISGLQAFDGAAIPGPAVARSIRPLHGTVFGASGPEPDPQASDFQGYSRAESEALKRSARTKGLLAGVETVLDYGFGVGERRLEPGQTGLINVAVRLPRRFQGSPTPYRFKLGFLVTTGKTVRVSQALGETPAKALERAQALLTTGGPVQLVLLGGGTPPQNPPGLSVVRLPNLRVGTAPTFLLE